MNEETKALRKKVRELTKKENQEKRRIKLKYLDKEYKKNKTEIDELFKKTMESVKNE